MNDNTTQDDLLAKINGLTSGMSLPEEPVAPQVAPAPQVEAVPPVMPQEPIASIPEPAPMPVPEISQPASNPIYNETPVAPVMPAMPSMPEQPSVMPEAPQAMPVAPEMPIPNQDPFAASIGVVPVEEQPAAPATDIPTMGASRIPVPDNKIPTFDKPVKKKSNGGFVFIIVLLILLILGAGGFALYTHGFFDSLISKFIKTEPVEPIVDDSFINVDPVEPVVEEPTFKDETKTAGVAEKVIEAKYIMEGEEYDSNYIKLPYLNLTSEDAKKVNSEIFEMFKNYAKVSSEYKKENDSNIVNDPDNFKQKYLLVYYQAITQGDIISLLINELNYEGSGDAIWNHKTYTLSASTGKTLELKDLETILNVDDNAMNASYEAYIATLISQSTASEAKKTFEHKINAFKTLQDYYSNINSKSGIEYYVDGMGRINIVTKVYIGDKNIFKVVAYGKDGCAVKTFKINDAKTAVNYQAMTPSANNNKVEDKEAVVTTASSNLKVSAKTLSSYKDGDLISGDDLIKLYLTYENMLGQKGDSMTFQLSNLIGSKSYSKGDIDELKEDVKTSSIYQLQIINYANGSYRIIKAKLYEE